MTVHDPEMPATTTTTPSSPPPLTAQQIESYLAAILSTYTAAQAHPRYRLRYVSLCAIAGGVVLNVVSSIVAFSSNPNAPRWVVFWAGVVVCRFPSFSVAPFSLSLSVSLFLPKSLRGGVFVANEKKKKTCVVSENHGNVDTFGGGISIPPPSSTPSSTSPATPGPPPNPPTNPPPPQATS